METEVAAAGLEVLDVVGVEGPAGGLLESVESAGEELIDAALLIARTAASLRGIRDMSAHLMAIAEVPR